MRFGCSFLSVFALVVFAIGGCSDVAPPAETATLDLLISRNGTVPLEGVQVCVGETDNCDSSDSDGEVSLRVPIDEEIYYTLRKEGYDSILIPTVIPENGVSTVWYLYEHGVVADLFETAMSPYPRRGTGSIFIAIQSPPIAGVTFDLVGATGKRYYQEGRAYLGEDVSLRLDLTATTSQGIGGFLEVTPGDEYQIKLGGTASDCRATYAGWRDGDNSVRIPVLQDHETWVTVRCPIPP